MRFALAAMLAVLTALLLFEMMFGLIHSEGEKIARPAMPAIDVTPIKPQAAPQKKRENKPQQQEPAIDTQVAIPQMTMAALELSALSPIRVDHAALNLNLSMDADLLQRQQHNWLQPSSMGAGEQGVNDYIGERDSGTKEIVPIATRAPLIPKVAWDNKIDGWVLVAFAVNNQGRVEDVRIMDASPRGVFEAHAASAVQKWRYASFQGPKRYLSQRVEFNWKNYPMNWGEF